MGLYVPVRQLRYLKLIGTGWCDRTPNWHRQRTHLSLPNEQHHVQKQERKDTIQWYSQSRVSGSSIAIALLTAQHGRQSGLLAH